MFKIKIIQKPPLYLHTKIRTRYDPYNTDYELFNYDSFHKEYKIKSLSDGKIIKNLSYTEEEITNFIKDGHWIVIN